MSTAAVDVTVAIPVRDGGELLAGTLRALSRQTVAHELLVCDSGSRDGSVALARERGELPGHAAAAAVAQDALRGRRRGAPRPAALALAALDDDRHVGVVGVVGGEHL